MQLQEWLDEQVHDIGQQYAASLERALKAAELVGVGLCVHQPVLEQLDADHITFTWGIHIDRDGTPGTVTVQQR